MFASVGLVRVAHDGHLSCGQLLQDVVSNELNLTLVVLQVGSFLAGRLRLLFLKSKNGIVKDLAESVVVEIPDGHLGILALGVEVVEHLSEHFLLVARAHPSLILLDLLDLVTLLIRVEFQLLGKDFTLRVAFPVTFLELGFNFL